MLVLERSMSDCVMESNADLPINLASDASNALRLGRLGYDAVLAMEGISSSWVVCDVGG